MGFARWKCNDSNWNSGWSQWDSENCVAIKTNGILNDIDCGRSHGAIFESTFEISGLTCNEYVGCQDTVKIVENGTQTSDTSLRNSDLVTQTDSAGAYYLSVPGSAAATTADDWNVNSLPIGANNDFVLLAKLKVDGSGSEAAFIINSGDVFVFATNSNGIFGKGHFSGVGQTNYGTHSDNLFYFKVERKLGTIKFYINEEEVASFVDHNESISKFTWQPWRANLKIYDFTVSSPSLIL